MSNFSVIVPIYYGEKYIPGIIRQIEFCKSHMGEKDLIEVVFVNDTPNAPINLKEKSEIIDIKVINLKKNIGIHGARLKGLRQCKGEFVFFLDQDDKIDCRYFESQIKSMGMCDAVVCKAIHDKICRYGLQRPFEKAISINFMITQGNGIVSPGQVLLRKDFISSVWKRNVLLHNGADDWLLWICMMKEKKEFALNDEILYEHVVDGKNASGNFLEMTYSEYEMLQILEKEGLLNARELKLLKETVDRLCQEEIRIIDKYRKTYFLCGAWMQLCIDDCSIGMNLKEQGYKTIAIYGDGIWGKQLYKVLKKENVRVTCFIDKNADNLKEEILIYKPEDNFPDSDLIVITLLQECKEVEELLQKKSSAKIIYLDKLIEEIKKIK